MGSGVKKLTLILVSVLAISVAAPTAFAGGSSVLGGHTSQPAAAQVLGKSAPKAASAKSPTATVASGNLPFTGLDLGIVGAMALTLAAAGGVLRRAGRQKR